MAVIPVRLRRVSRRLLHAPLFTSVAVLTLALGIGANTAIFTVVNGVLMKPLPFRDSDRLVGLWHSAPGVGFPTLEQGSATYFLYRESGTAFEDIGLWDTTAVSVTGIGEPERVQALRVTDGTLGLLRVELLLGRRFTRDDDTHAAPARVMLAHAYWERKFGSDPGVVGRHVVVDSKPREIIGVLPASFRFLGQNPQLVLPFRFNRAEALLGEFSYRGVARLKPGVTIEQANADIARMIPLLIEKFPLIPGFSRQMFDEVRLGPKVRPLADDVIGDVGQVLWVLLGTVGIVLLIASANVANLFLVRAEGRQQELAIHAALGANWRRIGWELLSESLTLALIGGFVGVGFAYAGIRTLVGIAPQGLPRLEEITIDPIVLLFTLGISLIAGVLFGLIPVFKFATPHLAGALKEGGRLSSAGRERHRARNAIAAAVALLLGVVGIYGVISYIATQRTREIGIRIALGAARGDVSRLFLRYGLVLAAVGIGVGVVAAAFVTRVMATLLFGVSALDAVTYVVVAAGLGGTALLASYLPAMRAARVDPAEALRWEA